VRVANNLLPDQLIDNREIILCDLQSIHRWVNMLKIKGMELNSGILEMEAMIASRVGDYLKCGKIDLKSFSSELEWFLTWRIKLEDLSNRMWCDGVFDLKIKKLGRHAIDITGMAYIGPESNAGILYESAINGKFKLSKNNRFIEDYEVQANVNDRLYVILKKQ